MEDIEITTSSFTAHFDVTGLENKFDFFSKQYATHKRELESNDRIDILMRSSMAAFIASGTTCALYNPLDCLRVRWQLLPRSEPVLERGLVNYGFGILKQEGLIQGLWKPGLAPGVTGMALSASIRLGLYESLRDAIGTTTSDNDDGGPPEKSFSQMFMAGMVCGALGYSMATPFHLLKTMSQADLIRVSTSGGSASMQDVIGDGGLRNCYRGALPLACRGAFFTAGQMLGYDGMKTIGKSKLGMEDGVFLHVISSLSASLGSALLASPADLVMTKYMSDSSGNRRSLVYHLRNIYAERGVISFWRGWNLMFLRLVPMTLTFCTLYEEGRFLMGIGYLT